MSNLNAFENLTKEQKYILATLYKSYSECVETGNSKTQCNNFGNIESVYSRYFEKLHFDDVESNLKKLKTLQFIHGFSASDTLMLIKLTDTTVVYFENRFKRNIKKVVEFISDVAKFIPGL